MAAVASPMSVPLFRALWIASAVSNLGTWIQDVGQGWLMTSLTTSPLWVSLVSASVQIPGLVLALPAGVLADLVDRRRLLVFTQSFMALSAAALALLTFSGHITPISLLLCTLGLGIGAALNGPAWYSAVADVVPRSLLPRAVVWNGVAWNVARAVGPAIGGLLVAALGPAPAFALNGLSFLATISVLRRWPSAPPALAGPPEGFASAIIAGLRYARHNADLRAVVGRAGMFSLFAISGLALMPVYARQQLHGGPSTYGILLGCVGAGAILGAASRAGLQRFVRGPVLMPIGMGLIAAALLVLGRAHRLTSAAPALCAFGFGWLLVLSTANAAAQLALPVWVRARGLGIYLLSVSGAMAAGSAVAGQLATDFGVPFAFTVSAIGLGFGMVLSILAPLPDEGGAKDLSAHAWSEAPRIEGEDRGPVIVMLRYPLALDADRIAARAAVRRLAAIRLRDGATDWRLYEDADQPDVLVEVFTVGSWHEHLRQHERGTVDDRQVFERAAKACGGAGPEVIHLVAAP